jgi:3-oxoadipate enol-lactonase
MAVLKLPGVDLHYEVKGSGVPLVLVHGLALDVRMWDDQVDALGDVATVIRYDARGFGRSTRTDDTPYTNAGDLWLLLDHLGIERAVLVGLSMGGGVVLEAALAAQHRVQALVLLDAYLDGVPWDPAAAAGMERVSAGLAAGGLPAAKAAWLSHDFFVPARRSVDLAARLAAMVTDYSGVQWTAPDPHGPHPDTLPLLPTLCIPTTVVVGELDVPCFRTMAEILADRIPGARLAVVPDAGHLVNMEAPDPVNALLRSVVLEL